MSLAPAKLGVVKRVKPMVSSTKYCSREEGSTGTDKSIYTAERLRLCDEGIPTNDHGGIEGRHVEGQLLTNCLHGEALPTPYKPGIMVCV